jgi:hypothetical protein
MTTAAAGLPWPVDDPQENLGQHLQTVSEDIYSDYIEFGKESDHTKALAVLPVYGTSPLAMTTFRVNGILSLSADALKESSASNLCATAMVNNSTDPMLTAPLDLPPLSGSTNDIHNSEALGERSRTPQSAHTKYIRAPLITADSPIEEQNQTQRESCTSPAFGPFQILEPLSTNAISLQTTLDGSWSYTGDEWSMHRRDFFMVAIKYSCQGISNILLGPHLIIDMAVSIEAVSSTSGDVAKLVQYRGEDREPCPVKPIIMEKTSSSSSSTLEFNRIRFRDCPEHTLMVVVILWAVIHGTQKGKWFRVATCRSAPFSLRGGNVKRL